MSVTQLLDAIVHRPASVTFDDVIATINAHYHYTPVRFRNGIGDDQVISEPGKNEGSCKIFAFGQLQRLNEAQTLACFGDYYRNDVLNHPDGTDHANIRTFMRHGWRGVEFDHMPLTPR